MDLYSKKSGWKVILIVVGMFILAVTLFYSNYLANRLKENEEKTKKIYIQAIDDLANIEDLEADIALQDLITDFFTLPSIIVTPPNQYDGSYWGEKKDGDPEFLKKKVDEFLRSGQEPVDYPGGDAKIYIFNSPLVKLIQFYPILQGLLVGLFIALGYYLFNTARRAEQNRVWAGMAKETAHQLGTPISAIMAWIQYLQEANVDDPAELEVLDELTKDVDRLELIADRFSKIGSAPELELTNIYDQLSEIKDYMQRRASRRVTFDFPNQSEVLQVAVNRHLFSWVLENLIRNSLDAMGGEGQITAQVSVDGQMVNVDLSDTGKGIPQNKLKTVFQPGYTTKKRGWGLGLSLAKRIIENYHKGKIFVKSSKLDEGTTFSIRLPKA